MALRKAKRKEVQQYFPKEFVESSPVQKPKRILKNERWRKFVSF